MSNTDRYHKIMRLLDSDKLPEYIYKGTIVFGFILLFILLVIGIHNEIRQNRIYNKWEMVLDNHLE